jgi:SRSO17 transposase
MGLAAGPPAAAERLVGELQPTAWAVDDTGFPKDGPHSVGVQRQYCGTLGKTANCQLGVSVNAVTEQASCPLDWRLFLPEGWDDDAKRRAAAHVPERVRHRPKWQLVLDMLDELAAWDLSPPVLVADAGYGEVGEFRQGLDDRQIAYVVQVKADTSADPEHAHPTTVPHAGKGCRPSGPCPSGPVPPWWRPPAATPSTCRSRPRWSRSSSRPPLH